MKAGATSLWRRLAGAYLSGMDKSTREPLPVNRPFLVYMWAVVGAGALTLVPIVRNFRPEVFADPLFILLALGTVVVYPLMYLRSPGLFSSLDVSDGLIFVLIKS